MNETNSRRTSILWTMPTQELQNLVSECSSYSEVLRLLGLSTNGASNNVRLKQRMHESKINFDHIKNSVSKYKNLKMGSSAIPLDEVMIENSYYSRGSLKRRLLSQGLLSNECAICGLCEWRNQPIALRLDHINGIPDDHRLENLRILCPNCDSQQITYAGRNVRNKKSKKLDAKSLGISFTRKVERPGKELLNDLLWKMPTIAIAKNFKVSDKAVEKWAKSYGLSKPPRGYWQKKKFNK